MRNVIAIFMFSFLLSSSLAAGEYGVLDISAGGQVQIDKSYPLSNVRHLLQVADVFENVAQLYFPNYKDTVIVAHRVQGDEIRIYAVTKRPKGSSGASSNSDFDDCADCFAKLLNVSTTIYREVEQFFINGVISPSVINQIKNVANPGKIQQPESSEVPGKVIMEDIRNGNLIQGQVKVMSKEEIKVKMPVSNKIFDQQKAGNQLNEQHLQKMKIGGGMN